VLPLPAMPIRSAIPVSCWLALPAATRSVGLSVPSFAQLLSMVVSQSRPLQVNDLSAPANLNYSTSVISDTRMFYDDQALATTWPQPASPAWPQQTAPTTGDVSVVQKATGYSGGAFTYQTVSTAVYDSYGRVIKSYDANGGYNGTTYTPTTTKYTMTGGSTTSQTVTNPLGQSTTTDLDPLRGLPVETIDANGIATNMQYDELGRLTDVWEYGRATTLPANIVYTYSVTPGVPVVVTTKQLNDASGYITSTSLYDSLLRLRQTQVPTPQGGILVTDQFYDSHGWQWKTNLNWWDSTASPGSAILTVPDSQVPDQTVTQFDGLGRPVIVTSYDDSAVKSVSYTQYTGDKVTTIPAAGGTPTTVTTDALGRQTELDSYASAPAVSTSTNPGGFSAVTLTGGTSQATTYSYDTRGWLSDIKDLSTGETWSRSYNQLGQIISSTDPNSGTAKMTYDADGNLTSATDADQHTITYTYDPLGRRTGEYDGTSASAPQIASWTYDNSNNAVAGMTDPVGQLTTETSTYGGNTFTFQQTGFNAFGESLGEQVTIPAAEGNLAGTYTLTHTYSTTAGLPLRDSYPASPDGGALPAETVTHTYTTGLDLPSGLSSNLAAYAQSTTYTDLLQVAQEEIGSTTNHAFVTNTYDPHTGALTDSQVTNTAVSATPFDNTSYAYDPSGNLTSQQDVRNGTQTELQCYSYDLLDRLTSAWTTNGTAQCSAGPSTGSGGTVGDGIPGGTYWTSWTYNALGDQLSQTQHSVTGGTDTVTNYAYNNGNGTASGQPDTLTGSVTTGPGAGSASYGYDAAGNTTSRDLPSGNQNLTWYDNGKLATDTTSSGTTSYAYDADGNLLVQTDPKQTTLFIFGEQLYLDNSSGAVTGTRYLALPGGGTAVRTGSGTSYSFELSDLHATSLLALDHTAANPVWRQQTPFGAPPRHRDRHLAGHQRLPWQAHRRQHRPHRRRRPQLRPSYRPVHLHRPGVRANITAAVQRLHLRRR
jgi:YD repeat-containing protein